MALARMLHSFHLARNVIYVLNKEGQVLTPSLPRIHVKRQATTGFRLPEVVTLGDAVNYGVSLCSESVLGRHKQ